MRLQELNGPRFGLIHVLPARQKLTMWQNWGLGLVPVTHQRIGEQRFTVYASGAEKKQFQPLLTARTLQKRAKSFTDRGDDGQLTAEAKGTRQQQARMLGKANQAALPLLKAAKLRATAIQNAGISFTPPTLWQRLSVFTLNDQRPLALETLPGQPKAWAVGENAANLRRWARDIDAVKAAPVHVEPAFESTAMGTPMMSYQPRPQAVVDALLGRATTAEAAEKALLAKLQKDRVELAAVIQPV